MVAIGSKALRRICDLIGECNMAGEDDGYYQGERRRNKSRKSMKKNKSFDDDKSGKNTYGGANNESYNSQDYSGYQEGSEPHTLFLRFE